MKNKIIRISTVPISLNILLRGQLKFLSKYFKVIAVSSPGIELTTVRDRENISVFPIKMERPIRLRTDIKSLYCLYILLKKEQPQIVHSITPKAGLLSMVASYFARVPIRLHTFTGLVFTSRNTFSKYLLINIDRLLCIFSTNVYPEGVGVKKDLIKYGITKKPLKVIANGSINGIDLDYFKRTKVVIKNSQKVKNQLGIEDKNFVLCFIGRIVKDKGINELLEVFSKLIKKYTELKLLLVGPFENDLDPISNISKQLIQNNKNIVSTGFKDDVRPYLAMSDVFVLPTYREGFPNVVMQAGAMGIPSVVTNINGCNEIIENEVNGLIVKPKDISSLENAISRLIENKSLQLKLSSNSRKMISKRFDQKYVLSELLKEYQSLVN